MSILVSELIDQIAFEIGDEEKKKFPPKFYVKIINQAITDIYAWLLQKKIDYKPTSEDISLVANTQLYSIKSGKTIAVYKDDIIPLVKKDYVYSFEFTFTAEPEFYFESLDETGQIMGFIPTPNAAKIIKRYYTPMPVSITGAEAEALPYGNDFEKLLVINSCLQTITIQSELTDQELEWLKLKTELFTKWSTQQIEIKDNLLRTYQPIISQPHNLFD